MRYAFAQIRFLGIQPSIWISAGQPLYLFFVRSEWFICKSKINFLKNQYLVLSVYIPVCKTLYKRRG